MSLHGRVDWDDKSRWDGRLFLMVSPPVDEGFVGMDVEALLWWWSFGKSVGDISAEDEKVFSCGDGIKQSGAGLVDAVGVCFVKDFDVTRQ